MTPREPNAMKLSIVIPVLNEAKSLPQVLERLTPLRYRGAEVIMVDGGSEDDSVAMAACAAIRVMSGARGRARQMNAGASAARGDVLLFLHADTELPLEADWIVERALRDSGRVWGRFDVRIKGRSWVLWIVARLMSWRSRLTGIATGDQAVFVTRLAFETVGGFPDQPLMEDVELSKRLRALSPPACLRDRVITSGRRWEAHGVWRTIFLMWRLRWAYWRGVPARVLTSSYR